MIKCINCGSDVDEGMQFCPTCGAEIKQTAQKSKSKTKIIIIAAVLLVAIAAAAVVLILNRFPGKYVNVSVNNGNYYLFEKDSYIYKTEDSTKRGTYKVSRDYVNLKQEDDEKILIRHGKYLLDESYHFEQKTDDMNQTFTSGIQTSYKGVLITLTNSLNLYPDGAFTISIDMDAPETKIGKTNVGKQEGTYEIKNDIIILHEKDKTEPRIYVIHDGYIYYTVFDKQ